MRQAAALMESLQAQVPGPRGWVVCGDFNAELQSALVGEVLRRGFVDAYAGVGGATCAANGRARRVDFLFHSRGMRCAPAAVAVLTDSAALPSKEEPSDHLPIAGRFEWA
jgi:endonuclease/exonuclease/phosphatase family metal-dependent hydrolase